MTGMSQLVRRRKWRRVAIAAAVVALLLVAGAQLQSTSFDRRAARLTLGQTVDEVRSLMGEPQVGNYPRSGIFFNPRLKAYKFTNRWWKKLTGRRDFSRVRPGWMEQNSVGVVFQNGRLVCIERGHEVIRALNFVPK
jgi:hypothetical protein